LAVARDDDGPGGFLVCREEPRELGQLAVGELAKRPDAHLISFDRDEQEVRVVRPRARVRPLEIIGHAFSA